MNTRQRPARPRPWWQKAALFGQAAWFFGNLYEGVVGMPSLLADARSQRTSGLFGTGSPVRYYAPIAPLVFGSTGVTLVRSWRSGDDRRLITVVAVSTTAAAALSTYLIRSVNLHLLTSEDPLNEEKRRRMIRTWHRTNIVRLLALAAASASLSHATSKPPPPDLIQGKGTVMARPSPPWARGDDLGTSHATAAGDCCPAGRQIAR